MSRRSRALLAIIIAAITAGGNPTFTKIALSEFPPLGFIFARFILSLACLSPLLVRRVKKLGKEILPVFYLSLLSTANIILFTFGVRRTTATMSQMIYAVVPILAAIVSAHLLKEKMTLQKTGGVALGLVGMLLIVLLPLINHSTSSSGDLEGNLMIVIGAILFSVYTVLSKQFQKKYSPVFLTAAFFLTTAGSTGVLALPESMNRVDVWSNISLHAWLSLAYVAIGGTVLYYYLFQYAIQNGSPLIASMSFYLAPVAAFGWAFFILGERLTTTLVLGALFVLAGAWIVTRTTGAK